MSGPRFAHTATWTQDNEIVVIGGAAGTGGLLPTVGLSSIEVYDPVANSWTTKGATLSAPRAGHTATLLGDGRVLIFGGFTPGSAAVLPVEIYNPLTGAVTALPAPPATMNVGRHEHTVTRLFDGRLLIAGGRSIVNGALFADALIYNAQGIPQAAVGMDQTRAQHAATLMGNGHVLFTGGVGGIGVAPFESFTTTVAVWSPTTNFFTPVDSLIAGRGDHTATAGGSGSVYVIGGRNGSPLGNNFLIDLEFYSFSNSVPFIPQVATSTASTTNMVSIDFDVEDEDGDGGYASCRYRETSLLPGVTDWHQCTISSQVMPGGAVVAPPTFMIIPGANSFIWDFTSDGVPAGTQVEVEVLPVGCVLGTPKRMVVETTL